VNTWHIVNKPNYCFSAISFSDIIQVCQILKFMPRTLALFEESEITFSKLACCPKLQTKTAIYVLTTHLINTTLSKRLFISIWDSTLTRTMAFYCHILISKNISDFTCTDLKMTSWYALFCFSSVLQFFSMKLSSGILTKIYTSNH
jgi:hypothetical protein